MGRFHCVVKSYSTYNNSFYQAYHRGHRYPFYTWILYGWYDSGWWKTPHSIGTGSENCTDEQVSSVLEYSFALRVYPKPSDKDATSDMGIVSSS